MKRSCSHVSEYYTETLAQWLERLAINQEVSGSNPLDLAKNNMALRLKVKG